MTGSPNEKRSPSKSDAHSAASRSSEKTLLLLLIDLNLHSRSFPPLLTEKQDHCYILSAVLVGFKLFNMENLILANYSIITGFPYHTNSSKIITVPLIPLNSSCCDDSNAILKANNILQEQFTSEFKFNMGTYLYKLYLKQRSVEVYKVPGILIWLLYFFYGLISIMSLLGNGMVVWVIAVSHKMRTVTNLYIGNMAIADILIGLFVVPFQFQVALLRPWYLPKFMCAFSPFFQVLSVNLSVFSLCAIALDRLGAVLHPLSARVTKTRCVVVICVIWIAALMLALPTYYDYKIVVSRTLLSVPHTFCLNSKLSPELRLFYNLGLFIVQYLIPLYIISVAYSQMAVRLWGRVIPGNQELVRDAMVCRGKKRVIKTLAVVVLVFGICWFPLQLYTIVQYIYPPINNYPYINVVWFGIHYLAMSNACINPFIYAVYNNKFQEEIIRRLGGCTICCCIFVKKAAGLTTLPSAVVSVAGESQIKQRFPWIFHRKQTKGDIDKKQSQVSTISHSTGLSKSVSERKSSSQSSDAAHTDGKIFMKGNSVEELHIITDD